VWFVGEPGGPYAFRLRAFDQNGQAEALPAEQAPEGVVAILRHGQPHASETDDSPAQARRLWLNEAASGNLCAAEDVDWSRFAVEQDGRDLLAAYSQSGGAAVRWR
jgi:hypothetical protein